MQVQFRHRFNVEQYYRMAETGILSPAARVELLDGVIHDMSPIGPLHGGVVNRLTRHFNLKSKRRWIVSTQNPIRLSSFSEPEPDVMLLKPAPDDYMKHHPTPDDVLLLIEVSDSTLEFDRQKKLPLYAQAGIPEVWIVNLQQSAIEIYREPYLTGYASAAVVKTGEVAIPQCFPDAALDVAEMLS